MAIVTCVPFSFSFFSNGVIVRGFNPFFCEDKYIYIFIANFIASLVPALSGK